MKEGLGGQSHLQCDNYEDDILPPSRDFRL
jgi:hypothetical protein